MSMLSNLELIRRVPLFALLSASQAESVASAVTAGATLIIVPRFSASTFWRTAAARG